jgi:hypothetical protein
MRERERVERQHMTKPLKRKKKKEKRRGDKNH